MEQPAIINHNWLNFNFLIILVTFYLQHLGLQCFDAVGWVAGRASGL